MPANCIFGSKNSKSASNQPLASLVKIPRNSSKNFKKNWGKVSKGSTRLRLQNYPLFFPQVLIFKGLFVQAIQIFSFANNYITHLPKPVNIICQRSLHHLKHCSSPGNS